MIYPRDITTEAEAAVLEHADRLAAVIGKHWHPTDDTAPDDVMRLFVFEGVLGGAYRLV